VTKLLKGGLTRPLRSYISRPAVGGANPLSFDEALQLANVEITRYGKDIAVSGYLK